MPPMPRPPLSPRMQSELEDLVYAKRKSRDMLSRNTSPEVMKITTSFGPIESPRADPIATPKATSQTPPRPSSPRYQENAPEAMPPMSPSIIAQTPGSARRQSRLRSIVAVDFADASRPEAPGYLTPRTRTPSRIAARKAAQRNLPPAGSASAYTQYNNAERGMDMTPLREQALLTHALLRDMRPIPKAVGLGGGAPPLRARAIVNQHGLGMQRPTWWPTAA
jgi:hypothetical protein